MNKQTNRQIPGATAAQNSFMASQKTYAKGSQIVNTTPRGVQTFVADGEGGFEQVETAIFETDGYPGVVFTAETVVKEYGPQIFMFGSDGFFLVGKQKFLVTGGVVKLAPAEDKKKK